MFTKKITAMLAGVLCFCIQGFAQMMPDSTIQIVAYWQAGDKYSFKCKETKYQVDEKNDTTVLEARSEVRTFEIISQMKDRYHISLTYSDFYSSDEDEMKLDKAMNEVVGDYSIEFETNEFGILERFTNLQEVAVKMEPAVDYVVDNMYAENKDLKKMMPKRKMRSYMIAQTCTPAALQTAVLDDIGRLFFFHGARLDTVSTYTVEEEFTSIFQAGDSLKCKTNLWIDTEYTDDYSVVCRTYSEPADKKALSDWIAAFVTKYISDIVPMTKREKGEMEKIEKEMADKLKANFEQYTAEEIHLDSGWFINYYYDRYITIQSENKSKQIIVSRSIELMN